MLYRTKTKMIHTILSIFVTMSLILTCLITSAPIFTHTNDNQEMHATQDSASSYRFEQPQIYDAMLCYQLSNNKPMFVASKTDMAFIKAKSVDKWNRNKGYECILDKDSITDKPDNNSPSLILIPSFGGQNDAQNQTQILNYSYNQAYSPYMQAIKQYLNKTQNKVALNIELQYSDNTDRIPKSYDISAYSVEDDGSTLSFNVRINNIDKKDTRNG